jgi:exodeoxyribonuclease VII large subunit
VKDVIAVWRRRFPNMRVTLIPTAVQGPAAEQELIRAIELAPTLQPDVVLLTRGGGSLEDLWSFNLESVARALVGCPCPTVSAVGHEIDVTICDFVADMRAPTPSAAAELIVPDGVELQRTLAHQLRQLQHIWQRQIDFRSLSLDNLKLKLQSPERVLERANQRVDDAAERIGTAIRQGLKFLTLRVVAQTRQLQTLDPTTQLENAKLQLHGLHSRLTFSLGQHTQRQQQKLASLSRMLHSVSPLPTISRGYGLVTTQTGSVISSVEHLEAGSETVTYLQDGAIIGEIKQVQPGVTLSVRDEDES